MQERKKITTHWKVGLEYYKCDRSYYEGLSLMVDGSDDCIVSFNAFDYNSKYIDQCVALWEQANNAIVLWGRPDVQWYKQQLRAMGPWCQFCSQNPCCCGADYMRNVWPTNSREEEVYRRFYLDIFWEDDDDNVSQAIESSIKWTF